jgi:hypothetical protein
VGLALKLCADEYVEVLSKEEILKTLDEQGRYENVPFMPEMFQYCGRRFRVSKRAHKTCDFVTNTGIRSLPNAVHLEDLRCDGSAHGNCEAQCTIFWKEAWLKRTAGPQASASRRETIAAAAVVPTAANQRVCNEDVVRASCIKGGASSDSTYVCQATLLPNFTQPLSPMNIRPYVEDYQSGNVTSVARMAPRFIYRAYDNLINLGIGWGPLLRWLYDGFQRLRGGIPYPARAGRIPAGASTPAGAIGLQPGEFVRVKPYRDILETLDTAVKNRGMAFSAEMVPYCGGVHRVLRRVTRIVDEKTGKMLHFKNPCIILEGVVCQALYNKGMIFCPRATYPYWREIWLERVPAADMSLQHPQQDR